MTESVWLPEPSASAAPFFEGARRGELMLQRCGKCEAWHWPVRRRCSQCGAPELAWHAASGGGHVYSHGQLRRVGHPRHADRLPLCVASIDLDEGVRIVSNVVGCAAGDVRAGAAVRVEFETFPDGGVVPVFRLL